VGYAGCGEAFAGMDGRPALGAMWRHAGHLGRRGPGRAPWRAHDPAYIVDPGSGSSGAPAPAPYQTRVPSPPPSRLTSRRHIVGERWGRSPRPPDLGDLGPKPPGRTRAAWSRISLTASMSRSSAANRCAVTRLATRTMATARVPAWGVRRRGLTAGTVGVRHPGLHRARGCGGTGLPTGSRPETADAMFAR
jgi:hypothetical protein